MKMLDVESVLKTIYQHETINTLDLADILDSDHQKIVGIIKSIEVTEGVISCEQENKRLWNLTDEGNLVLERGSHEFIIFKMIPEEGIEQAVLLKSIDEPQIAKLGFSKAMSLGWITIDKSNGNPVVKRKVSNVKDETKNLMLVIKNGKNENITDKQKQELKKRKLIQEVTLKSFNIRKGPNFVLSIKKPEAELTSEMIIKGTWKSHAFKEYNFNAMGVPPERGHLHPLLKVREQFRQIFLEMCFTEMPTNNFVESSFWNFDSLFQPQQHPARDAHDTFFLSDPELSSDPPKDYMQVVKQVHSVGGYGSQGYKYDWKLEESKKNLLRTHTTAVSSRMLYKEAQKYKENPERKFEGLKFFSIDRVYRNETLDATHLAEFHQVEGVIADIDLTLGDLMGVLDQFFKKLGITKLRFKPAYNPYTEPSMEIFSYHEGLAKWVEVGNSGIFRPEMLLPMGLPKNVTVIAWGLSLERPTMIKYKIDNIRDLVGHKVDLSMVYENPICLLDK